MTLEERAAEREAARTAAAQFEAARAEQAADDAAAAEGARRFDEGRARELLAGAAVGETQSRRQREAPDSLGNVPTNEDIAAMQAAAAGGLPALGKVAYEAYCAFTGDLSLVSGARLPKWDHQTAMMQDAWDAAANAVQSAAPFTGFRWQVGPIGEVGRNGMQVEDVIQVAIDRLRELNVPPFNTRENSLAITDLESAQNWLYRRTREREERGVEGTSTP